MGKKKKKHKIAAPDLTIKNKIMYLMFFLIVVIVGFGSIMMVSFVRHRIPFNNQVLAIKDDPTVFLLLVPGFLITGILFIRIYDLYKTKFRFVQRIKKDTKILRKYFFIFSLISLNILITFGCYFHRTELTFNSLTRYNFLNQVTESYNTNDIAQIEIGVVLSIYKRGSGISYKIIYKEGKEQFFEQYEFYSIQSIKLFDDFLSNVQHNIKDIEKLDSLRKQMNYSDEDWKCIVSLFHIE